MDETTGRLSITFSTSFELIEIHAVKQTTPPHKKLAKLFLDILIFILNCFRSKNVYIAFFLVLNAIGTFGFYHIKIHTRLNLFIIIGRIREQDVNCLANLMLFIIHWNIIRIKKNIPLNKRRRSSRAICSVNPFPLLGVIRRSV